MGKHQFEGVLEEGDQKIDFLLRLGGLDALMTHVLFLFMSSLLCKHRREGGEVFELWNWYCCMH